MAERRVETADVTSQTNSTAGNSTTTGRGTVYVGRELTDADIAARKAEEKYNPVLRSKEKSATEVQAMGGLGAVAAALAAKKKKAASAATQAEALEKKQ